MSNCVNKKKTDSFKIVKIIVTVIFGLYALSLIIPLVWGLIVSITPQDYFIIHGFTSFPKVIDFTIYIKAFQSIEVGGITFIGMMINSIWYAAGSALLAVIVSTITAYASARYNFWGGKIIYWVAIISMMVPITSNLTSLFKLTDTLNMYDSPLILITQMSGVGFNFVVLYSFFKNISNEYAEAAFVDGAGHFYVFLKIYVPLTIPSMIALWLTMFIGYWGDPMFPLMFFPSFPTFASGLHSYQLEISRIPGGTPVLFASLFISAVPVVALFLIFREKFMNLQISGGLKG